MHTKTNINQTIILVISAVVILIIGLLLGQGISNKTTAELVGKLAVRENKDINNLLTRGEYTGGDPADNIIQRLSEMLCQKLEDLKNPSFESKVQRFEDATPPVEPGKPRKTLKQYCDELGYDVY